MQNRLQLALLSSLPNEISWALTKLVKLSYDQNTIPPKIPNYYIGTIPGLFETLVSLAEEIYSVFEGLNFGL
ncbi:hypothetical protein HK096_007428 [Nowakowskiella sp. JEL0078]|nr:hypothetical protein HK096_007428 [Nowakowskiella sp. JEL0078]